MSKLLVYVVVALGIVGIIGLQAVYLPNVTHGWFVFAGMTALLIGILTKLYWPVRKKWKAWPLLGALLLAHIVAYTALLRRISDVPILLYFLTIPLEVIVFQAVVYKAVGILPPKLKL